jgi:hypothetical protein
MLACLSVLETIPCARSVSWRNVPATLVDPRRPILNERNRPGFNSYSSDSEVILQEAFVIAKSVTERPPPN